MSEVSFETDKVKADTIVTVGKMTVSGDGKVTTSGPVQIVRNELKEGGDEVNEFGDRHPVKDVTNQTTVGDSSAVPKRPAPLESLRPEEKAPAPPFEIRDDNKPFLGYEVTPDGDLLISPIAAIYSSQGFILNGVLYTTTGKRQGYSETDPFKEREVFKPVRQTPQSSQAVDQPRNSS